MEEVDDGLGGLLGWVRGIFGGGGGGVIGRAAALLRGRAGRGAMYMFRVDRRCYEDGAPWIASHRQWLITYE